MRHMIDPLDFSVQEVENVLDLADSIAADPSRYREVCRYKKLATLFYEPSTRTRLSFEAAMLNLGGSVLGFSSADSSSASKGESIADTIRVISCYADICAIRHPKEGAPLRASMYSRIPVINAGDGGHQHPAPGLHHRPLRRPQVRPHGPFADQVPLPLQRHPVYPDLARRTAGA